MTLELAFDGILGLGIIWVTWRVLASSDLFRAVVLFIAYGLLMALAWVRLSAPDIALAEAAIGSGLTGALLLDAVSQIGSRAERAPARDETPAPVGAPHDDHGGDAC